MEGGCLDGAEGAATALSILLRGEARLAGPLWLAS